MGSRTEEPFECRPHPRRAARVEAAWSPCAAPPALSRPPGKLRFSPSRETPVCAQILPPIGLIVDSFEPFEFIRPLRLLVQIP